MQSSVKRRRLAALDKLSGAAGEGSKGPQGKSPSGQGRHSSPSPGGHQSSRGRQQHSRSPSAQREQGWSHRNSHHQQTGASSKGSSAAGGSSLRGRNSNSTASQPLRASSYPAVEGPTSLSGPSAAATHKDERQHAVYHPLLAGQLPAAAAKGLKIGGAAKKAGNGCDEMLLGLLSSSSRRLNGWETIQSKVKDKMIMLDNPAKQPSFGQGTRKRKEGGSNGTTRLLRSRKQCRKAGVRLDPAPAPSGQNCKGIERSTSQAAAGHELQKAAESLSHKWKEHLLLEVTPQGQSATQDFLAQSGFLGCRLKVKQALQACNVGLKGIVIRETKSALHVLDVEEGRVKALSKVGVVFECRLPKPTSVAGSAAAKLRTSTDVTVGTVMSAEITGDRIIAR